MMKKVVIVESPSKTKTISKYLGSDYQVMASQGHIRDLATSGKFGLGIDVEGDFQANYVPLKAKKKIITDLKKATDNAIVYLASDPDREGEAISWHLKDALDLSSYKRVVFNEITKPALLEAFDNPRDIDMDLVKSQETRRMLDRIIGFRLSKLMQSKTDGTSAGRVQSVALKLIVDREREIQAFKEEEYWTIKGIFPDFEAELEKYQGKEIEIPGKVDADRIIDSLSKCFNIESVTSKIKNKTGVMPFTTSTLQQTSINILNFNSTKTMRIAQKLYEGVDLGSETVGLITYMRTDSTRLSNIFVGETMEYIRNNFGEEYVGAVKVSKKKDNVQDAHEAIRPTSIRRTPEEVKKYLTEEEYKVYSLIYARALASLMANAKANGTTIILENNGYTFKATGSVIVFDGYLKVYGKYSKNEDVVLPDLSNYKSKIVIAEDIVGEQHFTKPAPRYTEATLIKEMETLGIGRPSTYAKTMETLRTRDYVTVEEKKFIPTEIGFEITDKLQECFSDIINVKYTKEMEDDLDAIAEAKFDNVKLLRDFYNKFEPLVESAFKTMEKKAPTETGEACPECGNPLVIRKGKYGEFVACSNYPECKYIKPTEKKVYASCPKCHEGDIVAKRTKKGKIFYGCSNFPNCNYALWDEPTGESCPDCGLLMVKKGKRIYCPECSSAKKSKETE
ncbi:MAG TPA: type I DNA topoisomerase [Firmicutes bacterium]|nr:type I DNA topoisomerase [Bacillota bacterium]